MCFRNDHKIPSLASIHETMLEFHSSFAGIFYTSLWLFKVFEIKCLLKRERLLNQISYKLTTGGRKKTSKAYNSFSDHKIDFICNITEESPQPCSRILCKALSNSNLLNYTMDSFLMTKSPNILW